MYAIADKLKYVDGRFPLECIFINVHLYLVSIEIIKHFVEPYNK